MTASVAIAAEAGLTEVQFSRVRDWVYGRTGIQFGDNKRYFVDKRVQGCVRAHGGTFDMWFAGLRVGTESLTQQLISELTVNETYFLREDRQFDALVGIVLPRIAQERRATRRNDPIRILSLPCSTGEEPYSIALQLLTRWKDLENFDVEIVAGDIDTRVLDSARRAEYGPRSMQRVSQKLRTQWFERVGSDRHRVKDDIRGAIDFAEINICDTASLRPHQRFDVVFCRNLLIYFDELSSRLAAENLFGAMWPGGYLFLGHSESMSRISSIFTPVRLEDSIVYQRPAIGADS